MPLAWIGLLLVAGMSWGCEQAAPPSPVLATAPNSEASGPPEGGSAPDAETSGKSTAPEKREVWDVFYIQDAKVGYSHTSQKPVEVDGESLIQIDSKMALKLERFGQTTEQKISLSTLETPQGSLVSFNQRVQMGPTPLVVDGRVSGGKLSIETNTAGKVLASQLDWPADGRGFFAMEMDLARQPMQPGETRRLQMLLPVFTALATVELKAKDFEATELLTGTADLLRIETVTVLQGGQRIASTIWTDRTGDTLKSYTAAMDQTAYRTTQEFALEQVEGAAFDLGLSSTVKPEHPLTKAHQTRRVVYRVELAGGDPAQAFVSCPTQRVRSTGPHTAEITVESVRPAWPWPAEAPPSAAPTAADRQPNNMIQSDNPKVQALAAEATRHIETAGGKTGDWGVAAALEKHVHRKIKAKNFSTAFATAAEVADTLEGDCTEHAVLLAAMARAKGIPARVAIGLVYAGEAGFAFHMWTEVYLDEHWYPLDATLGQAGIGAAHLKLADSNLDGDSAYASFLPVAEVLGRLKIDVVSQE